MKKTYGPMEEGDEDIKDITEALLGYTVVGVGKTETYKTKDWEGHVEGGLTLMLEKDGKKRKVILGYTELGEWLEYAENLKETK